MADTPDPIEIHQILEYLPHRYPFLLIDRVIDYEDMRRVVGIKNVTINEPFFQGHFPAFPIMPGVLIIEAMAQLSGVLILKDVPDRKDKLVFFAGIRNARFRKPVTPGDQLRIEMELTHLKRQMGKFLGTGYVGEDVVAEAEILFSMVDRSDFLPAESD